MKLVMTLLVRDEQDIIRANIDYHLAQGVDFIIATDNRSVDATAEILREFEAKGVLRYLFEGDDDYSQHAWVTRMARMACTDFGADWVINNDADEFWWPLASNLKETFERVPPPINIIRANRHNFVVVEESEQPFWSRMVYRERESLNPLGLPLPPKVAHRGNAAVIVGQGNHEVHGTEDPRMSDGSIEILHYPIRSYRQIENKIAKGGAAYLRNQDLPTSTGNTWRKLFEDLQRDANLRNYFQDNYYDEKRLAEMLSSGEILLDERLSGYFSRRM
jgi:hypothetical protein